MKSTSIKGKKATIIINTFILISILWLGYIQYQKENEKVVKKVTIKRSNILTFGNFASFYLKTYKV